MSTQTSFVARVGYERLANGIDLYTMQGSTPGIIRVSCSFPGGEHATYDMPTIATLLTTMLPGATTITSRAALLEAIDRTGSHIVFSTDASYLHVNISARTNVFTDVLHILIEILTVSTLPVKEYTEALTKVRGSLVHAQESTQARAQDHLTHALFLKGHPHWSPSIETELRTLKNVQRNDIVMYYRGAIATVGGIVVAVGDLGAEGMLTALRTLCEKIPQNAPRESKKLSVGHVKEPGETGDHIITLHDKVNVDTYLGITTTMTRDNSQLLACLLGVHVLGGSSTSRLFNELRTRQSLTYGAYASLQGLQGGYPGYLLASAVFPHDVFVRGLPALRTVVRDFIDRGITATELSRAKEEIVGKHAVRLSTTGGLLQAITSTVLNGREPSYLDEYLERVKTLTLREVNSTIHEYFSYDRAVTAAAGAIDQGGSPLA